jgi:hypothetical protein
MFCVRWSLGIFGVIVGEPWTLVGTAFNTLVMYQVCIFHFCSLSKQVTSHVDNCAQQVTNLTEDRMRQNKARLHEYLPYLHGTSMWVPWVSSYLPGMSATTNKRKRF